MTIDRELPPALLRLAAIAWEIAACTSTNSESEDIENEEEPSHAINPIRARNDNKFQPR